MQPTPDQPVDVYAEVLPELLSETNRLISRAVEELAMIAAALDLLTQDKRQAAESRRAGLVYDRQLIADAITAAEQRGDIIAAQDASGRLSQWEATYGAELTRLSRAG